MKKIFFLFTLIFVICLSLISCGEDSTINGSNVPVGTVFYSKDTLHAQIDAGGTYVSGTSTSFNMTVSAVKVKIEYRIQSNVDSSSGSTATYLDSTNGSPVPPSPLIVNVYSPVDTAVSFIYNVPSGPLYSKYDLWIYGTQPASFVRYIRFTDIKVTKVQ